MRGKTCRCVTDSIVNRKIIQFSDLINVTTVEIVEKENEMEIDLQIEARVLRMNCCTFSSKLPLPPLGFSDRDE